MEQKADFLKNPGKFKPHPLCQSSQLLDSLLHKNQPTSLPSILSPSVQQGGASLSPPSSPPSVPYCTSASNSIQVAINPRDIQNKDSGQSEAGEDVIKASPEEEDQSYLLRSALEDIDRTPAQHQPTFDIFNVLNNDMPGNGKL